MNNQLLYNIAITYLQGVGCVNAKKLIAFAGSSENVFKLKKQQLVKVPGIGESTASEILNSDALKKAEKEIDFINKYKIKVFHYLDKDYPEFLKNCHDAPVLFYSLGNINFNTGKFLSIIGTRKATEYGKTVCRKIIEELAVSNPDLTIVSGLAYGIDITAHKAAMDFGLNTIAVLGHGLDIVYPASHKKYASNIIKNGALITEFPSSSIRDASNFVKRNRIIAGISEATLVIETGIKGGSVITAEIANSYNREVFAVPGNVETESSQGCNFLIKSHRALLIENASDIAGNLNWNTKSDKNIQQKIKFDLNKEEEIVYEYVKANKNSNIDVIAMNTNIVMYELSSILLNLEFMGLVRCLPGKCFTII